MEEKNVGLVSALHNIRLLNWENTDIYLGCCQNKTEEQPRQSFDRSAINSVLGVAAAASSFYCPVNIPAGIARQRDAVVVQLLFLLFPCYV